MSVTKTEDSSKRQTSQDVADKHHHCKSCRKRGVSKEATASLKVKLDLKTPHPALGLWYQLHQSDQTPTEQPRSVIWGPSESVNPSRECEVSPSQT